MNLAKIITTTLILSTVFLACVSPQGLAPSNIPLTGKKVTQKLGKSSATESKWMFSPLCLASYGHPDMHKAVKSMIEKKKGNAATGIHWHTTDYCMLLMRYRTLSVEGDVVQLEDDYNAASK